MSENRQDYLNQEIEAVREHFDMEEIIDFQSKHEVMVIRGGDWNFSCVIDRGEYVSAFTPLYALVFGIKQYKKYVENKQVSSCCEADCYMTAKAYSSNPYGEAFPVCMKCGEETTLINL